MNNYIFFRTDRIGDFLLSAILLNSIKRNDPNSYITVICSSKNYDYVKNFHLVDRAVLYPEKNLFKKISFFLGMFFKKNYCAIVCDGKKRSIYSAILLRSKIKILFSTKVIHKVMFNFFFSKILIDKYSKSKILEIQNALVHIKFNFTTQDLNTLKVKNNKNFSINNKDYVKDRFWNTFLDRANEDQKKIWQNRYWEHFLRDEDDYRNHIDYIHFNPVKHGYVQSPTEWPFSSFHNYVKRGLLPKNWGSEECTLQETIGME